MDTEKKIIILLLFMAQYEYINNKFDNGFEQELWYDYILR